MGQNGGGRSARAASTHEVEHGSEKIRSRPNLPGV